ncbi:hypothetical protein SDC9_188953 [bioreactor metagenome]|uniref:Uncharacterized protein n=1 Tax=bioreactor metagenome TaxID=1076179 RepID=A0A645HR14_9ZZZZ
MIHDNAADDSDHKADQTPQNRTDDCKLQRDPKPPQKVKKIFFYEKYDPSKKCCWHVHFDTLLSNSEFSKEITSLGSIVQKIQFRLNSI